MMTMMNRLFLGFVLAIVGSVSAVGQPSKEKAELTRLLNDFLVGAGTNDAGVHDRFWAEDLIYTRSAGSRINSI